MGLDLHDRVGHVRPLGNQFLAHRHRNGMAVADAETSVHLHMKVHGELGTDVARANRVRRLDHAWIDAYQQRRKVQRLPIAPGSDEPEEPPPQPTEVQQEALTALAASRDAGYQRGLVVMAIGLGKTYLAAFDSALMQAKRVLFVPSSAARAIRLASCGFTRR